MISIPNRRRIAVIGSGAAALAAAWRLARHHAVTVFEKNAYLGGHANTVDVPVPNGRPIAVDTGFIVYNERTYPQLIRMFGDLDVPTQATEMSFGVSLDEGALEYSGGSLAGLFGQPGNLLRPRFLGMIADVLRFYREVPRLLAAPGPDVTGQGVTLGAYLADHHYGRAFVDDHLLPMAAAIWSAPVEAMLAFPAASFVRFCDNHGLLQLSNRPQWRTVTGGSREYIGRLRADMDAAVRLNASVVRIERQADAVTVVTESGEREVFDAVVIGTHADEALALLDRPGAEERAVLGAFRYQRNLAVLHGDARLMPRRRRVWSAWNYIGRTGVDGTRRLCVTYWMNRLQSLDPQVPLFVTLNPVVEPRAETVFGRYTYDHPVFDQAAMASQTWLPHLQGQLRTWYCGAYCGYGFHEDAFAAGLRVADAMGGAERPLVEDVPLVGEGR